MPRKAKSVEVEVAEQAVIEEEGAGKDLFPLPSFEDAVREAAEKIREWSS